MVFKRFEVLVLAPIILLTLIFRIPSFFEPAWYGDEMIRLVVAKEWFGGATLYSEIFDNSPPLLYLIFGLAPDLFWLKFLAFIWAATAAIVFYLLAKKFAKNFKLGKIYPVLAVAIFILLTSTPIFEGNIATAEIFILAPVISAMFLVWEENFGSKPFLPILAGILASAATMVRIQALTDLAAVAVFLIFFKNFKSVFGVFGGFFLVWVAIFLIFFSTGNWPSFASSVFLGNFDYVNYANQLFFPLGLLILKVFLTIFVLAILFQFKNFFTKFEIFIIIWLTLSFLGVSIGGRGFPHYLLQITPAVSLLIATIVRKRVLDFAKIFVFLIIFVSFFSLGQFYLPKTFSYYRNFLTNFARDDDYKNWFGERVVQSETIANYILSKTSAEDKIFVLADAPEIYFLTGRAPASKYVVSYHLNFQKEARSETLKTFLQEFPKIVVVYPEGEKQFPQAISFLVKNYKKTLKINSSQIWER